jgi:hypothetical protein
MTYLDSIVDQLFWSKVRQGEGCWEWQGHLNTAGYGYFILKRKTYPAHRFSVELANGEITNGLHVCHKCGNPRCVRPDHLFLGTHADNMRDMRQKGRGYVQPRRTIDLVDPDWPCADENHCWRGHEFTYDNTYVDRRGVKICRTCSRHNKREYKRRKREAAA